MKIPPETSLREALALLGLGLEHRTEGCAEPRCQQLDRKWDVDAICRDREGKRQNVSWHDQSERYDYRTLTIRIANDSGYDHSQWAKLIDHESRADLYVNGYISGVAWARADRVLAALVSDEAPCSLHDAVLRGSGGQRFAVLCESCCAGLEYVGRPESRGYSRTASKTPIAYEPWPDGINPYVTPERRAELLAIRTERREDVF